MSWWKKALVILGVCMLPVAGAVGYSAASSGCKCGSSCKCPPPCPCAQHAMR